MLKEVLLAILVTQGPVRETTNVSACPGCSIRLTHVATLGKPDDMLVPGDLSTVARDRFGNFFVSSVGLKQPILKYDKNGRFEKKIGRLGSGPGEFRWPGGVKVWHDTVVVPDISLGRVNYFTLDGKFVRSASFPMGSEGLVRGNGKLVVYGGFYAGTANNFPLHVIDQAGRLIRSFGSNGKPVDRADYFSKYRTIAPSGDSAVWAGYINRYEMELWSLTGQRLLTLRRSVPWYPRWREELGGTDYYKPNPRLACLREDGRGNLWSVIHVARPDWKAKGPPPKGETAVLPDPDRAAFSETIVEVIRIADGRAIASRRIHDYLDCYLSDGSNLLTTRKMVGADETLDVWSLDLVGT